MKHVICVDDSPTYLIILETILVEIVNDPDYCIEFVNDPLKGVMHIEALHESNQEVVMVISDYLMAGMNGLTFLKKVKTLYPNAKYVLLTGSSELELAVNALNSNVLDRLIIKSHNKHPEDVVDGVRNLLDAYRMEQLAHSQHKDIERLVETQRLQLIQTERMASIGIMAAGIAHEINNPLNIALGDIHMIRRDLTELLDLVRICLKPKLSDQDCSDIERAKEKIDIRYLLDHAGDKPFRCEKALQRIQKIVKDLDTFTHQSKGEIVVSDINESIESAIQLIPEKYKHNVEIIKLFAQLPQIACYGREINQVFMSILLNACQAMQGNGVLKIQTTVEADKYIVIEIIDDGPGIPKENLKRIFEPFFTTKPIGEGVGLGLSLCYAIMQKHGGEITAANNPGKGAQFTVKLLTAGVKKIDSSERTTDQTASKRQ